MPSMTKLLTSLSLLFGIPIYLIYVVKEGLEFQIAGGIFLLSLTSLLLFSGTSPIKPLILQKENMGTKKPQIEDNIELPPPVLENEGASDRRNQKIKRSRGRSNVGELSKPELLEVTKSSLVIEEISNTNDAKIAMPYVASIDAQSEMESEIDLFISQKRLKRQELKKRITIERRMKLAKRKASKASHWTAEEDGEDISGLLKDPNHGLTILLESEEVDSTIPHGISYVRIDQHRILKVRIPLNIPHNNQSIFPPLPDPLGLPPLPDPPGLPPLPDLPGLPPLPDPPPVKYSED
ncbi:MAG: hypothetical protein ACJZ4F_01095 [Candidatus Thalassarchaeaceae archaeon]